MGRAIIYSELQLDEDVSSASGAYFSVAFTILASIVLPTLAREGEGGGKAFAFRAHNENIPQTNSIFPLRKLKRFFMTFLNGAQGEGKKGVVTPRVGYFQFNFWAKLSVHLIRLGLI